MHRLERRLLTGIQGEAELPHPGRDLHGLDAELGEARPDAEAFDPDESNPFVDFLKRKAKKIGSPELDPDHIRHWTNSLPEWPIFEAWLDRLTNIDPWARWAIEGGHKKVRIRWR